MRGVGQTIVVETLFNRGRKLEKKRANEKQTPHRRVWLQCIKLKIASNLYRFKEPDWESTTAGAASNGRKLPKCLFKNQPRQVPKLLRKIVSTKQTPPWHTASVTTMGQMYADVPLMVEAFNKNAWGDIAAFAGISILVTGTDLIVQDPATLQWFLCIGSVCSVAGLGWPVFLTPHGENGHIVRLDLDGCAKWVLMYDLTWPACSVAWLSPLSQYRMGIRTYADIVSEPHVLCYAAEKPMPVLKVAASAAFWTFKKGSLAWLATTLRLKHIDRTSVFGLLWGLIRHALPDLSEDEVLDIIARRLRASETDVPLLDPDMADLVDDKDRKDFNNAMSTEADNKLQADTFWGDFKKKRRELRGGDGNVTHRSSGSGNIVNPCVLPEDEIDLATAREYCPNPFSLFSDGRMQRWQVSSKTLGSRSRAWREHTYMGALRQVLAFAWEEVLKVQGLDFSHCPVASLRLPANAAAVPITGAASSSGG